MLLNKYNKEKKKYLHTTQDWIDKATNTVTFTHILYRYER